MHKIKEGGFCYEQYFLCFRLFDIYLFNVNAKRLFNCDFLSCETFKTNIET